MNPNDTTARGQTESLSFEFELNHPPEKVWRALTDPKLLQEWLLPVVGFELRKGSAFKFQTQAYPGWDGVVDCRVLEVEPLQKISYSWCVPTLETVVTFMIAPTPTGTRLFLVQSGFKPDQKQAFGGARYGWKLMGGRLVELLARAS